MLSILIPTYNYNIYPLVSELFNQAKRLKIEFEIIVLDDCSEQFIHENKKICNFKNTIYSANNQNLGRATTINKLVNLSKFEHCLLLEADSFPENSNYIKLYIDLIKKGINIAFGGVIYSSKKPSDDSLLRWIYGQKRESRNLNYRIKNPSNIVFSWNLLIDKTTFKKYPFDTSIKDYGFEDLVFLKTLAEHQVDIHQIANNLIHHNNESSQKFIEKYHFSLKNLKTLLSSGKIKYSDTNLTRKYYYLKKTRLDIPIKLLFLLFKKPTLNNLNSKYCSLFLFDFYKLGYFCLLNNRKDV